MAKNENNPRNPASPLFKRLTRLLSGPVVNYRTQVGRQERRADLDKYRYRFRSMSGQEFKRHDSNLSQNYNLFTSAAFRNQNRAERYIDFEQMEYMPEIASSLDIYADEMTTHSALQPMLNIQCSNEEIKAVLDSLYHNVMNIQFNLFGWCRSMCKYGDYFLYLDIDESKGIQNVIGLPSQEVERLEGEDKTNPNYVQYQWNGAGMTFENWQVAHFRILGNDRHAPYGTSVLDPARRIWRQLVLLEDAMIAYRVVRAPERRIFKIDVGNIPPQDVSQYMEKVKQEMKRNSLVDASTGRVDLRYNPLSLEEDYFIPMRGGVGSDITSLPGAKSLDDIEDVKYLRDKMFAAIKVPQSYLTNLEGDTEEWWDNLMQCIEKAQQLNDNDFEVHRMLAEVALSSHDFKAGERHARTSFKMVPNDPRVLSVYGEILSRTGSTERGIELLESALELDPIPMGKTNTDHRTSAVLFGYFMDRNSKMCKELVNKLQDIDFKSWLVTAKICDDEEIEYRSEPWFADNKDQFKEMDWDMEIDRFHLNNEGLQQSLGDFVKKFFS